VQYRVEVVSWGGHADGATHLQARLNEFAAEGWEVVSILPTTASTSIRAMVSAHASADTTEFAVVLRRSAGPRRGRSG
jgi:hypothetical protein